MDALAGHVVGTRQLGQQFGDLEGPAVQLLVAAIRRGGGLHTQQRGRGHLAAGHTVDGVVDEHHRDVLAAVAGVDGLGGTDSGQVTVALIGEHVAVGVEALDGGGDSGSAAVGSLLEVDVEIIVGHHRASHGGHADGLVLYAEFLDDLGDDAVSRAVAAARAIVHNGIRQNF